ncbi:MAG: hypothetical protein QXZ22_08185 [Sulfolobales archaeon]
MSESETKLSNEIALFAVIIVTTVLCLTVLAISYWYIMKQDATVLTTVSALIGTVVGYYFKILKDRISKGG